MKLKSVTKNEVLNFDWEDFSKRINRLFGFFSKHSRIPINADRWEEFIYMTLRDMGEKYKGGLPRWDIGSHSPGADIWIDKFAISAKSGTIKNNFLTVSSNRLTRFGDLKEMLKYIDGSGKNFDFYLCCSRTKTKKELKYEVFITNSNIFKASLLNWEETFLKGTGKSSGWMGTNKIGLTLHIRKKMSNQLWISIPLSKCKKISEFIIPIEKLGATPIPF